MMMYNIMHPQGYGHLKS